MGIRGLDQWLTTPPEEPDWIEEAEKFLKQREQKQPENEWDAYIESMIRGLLDYIEENI